MGFWPDASLCCPNALVRYVARICCPHALVSRFVVCCGLVACFCLVGVSALGIILNNVNLTALGILILRTVARKISDATPARAAR